VRTGVEGDIQRGDIQRGAYLYTKGPPYKYKGVRTGVKEDIQKGSYLYTKGCVRA